MSKQQFEISAGYKKWTNALLGVGILTLVLGFIFLATSKEELNQTRFWAVLLQNSVFFLLVVNASMFFICATTLAMGGWQMAFRRVPEAISSLVPVFGVLALVVFLGIIFGHQYGIYHWLDKEHVEHDPILKGKSAFLNPTFFLTWTIISLFMWSWVGAKMRKLSSQADEKMDKEQSKKFIWTNTVWASIFIVFFALTVGSTIPWLWLMSIDAHWFSTMYSWYTLISSFVAGMSLVAIYVIYLKNQDYLEYVTEEHLHDIGKFMFAFSVFWTYLWYSQFMLIWYANIPEEVIYFQTRWEGYKALMWTVFFINFALPMVMLMSRDSKRNFFFLMFVGTIIFIGHYLDVIMIVMPGTVGHHWTGLSWMEFGNFFFFLGLFIYVVLNALAKAPLRVKNHPFLQESLHHSI